MGCNTSKDAVLSVEDNNTGASCDQQQAGKGKAKEKIVNNTINTIPEIDIDLNDPETEKAATKIQAVFRGHKTRQNMKSGDIKEAVQDLEAEFSPNDQELCHAATKIQASFRGHMARKAAPIAAGGGKGKPEEDLSKELQKLDAKVDDELADIDLSDPDLNKAATKIQASFRGHKVRKEVIPKDGENGEEMATGQ